MRLAHEVIPHGVPDSCDWKYGPRLSYGNNCPLDWSAFTVWGQLFTDETQAVDDNPAPNTRVQIRNMRALLLKNTGEWIILQNDSVIHGALYVEDFVENENKAADIRQEAEGGISITAGGGYNFHCYPPSRVDINPSNIRGIITLAQVRLILDNPSGPDDRALARYCFSMGGDYWRSRTASWSSDWSNNGDAGIGRFKRVGAEWRTVYMHTMTDEALIADPPPLALLP